MHKKNKKNPDAFFCVFCAFSWLNGSALLGIIVALTALFVLPGCGYTTQEMYPARYTTVAVPNFENRTFDREVEFELREALIKEIEQRTPYKVVRTPGAADTLLEGTVVEVQRSALSRQQGTGLPQEVEVTVVIDFVWRDLRSGEDLRGYRGFAASGQYIPVGAVGEFDATAKHRAIQRLAKDMVSTMREDGW